jgi:hypothetical protein
MRRGIVIPVLTLLIGFASGVAVREAVVAPARAQGQAAPNHEYDAVMTTSIDKDKEAMSKHASEGWRLVAATTDGHGFTRLYFERQRAR